MSKSPVARDLLVHFEYAVLPVLEPSAGAAPSTSRSVASCQHSPESLSPEPPGVSAPPLPIASPSGGR